MKKYFSVLLAAALAASLTACTGEPKDTPVYSGTEAPAESSANAEPEAPADTEPNTPADTTAAQTEAEPPKGDFDWAAVSEDELINIMASRSLMTTGDMTRMANVLKKAQNGEEITIAYIGGSITYGMTVAPAEPEKCWAYLTYEWLCEQFPSAKINYVNAGISGTPSILGNIRLERDVLAFDPDIVFVEFAVNDGTGNDYKNSYESLVRTLLTQDKDIAVALFFTILKSGHTCQPHMSRIGANYGLPMISEPDSLWEAMQAGKLTWEDYSDDESHPNEYGHSVVAQFMKNYFTKVIDSMDESCGEVSKELPAPVFSDRYDNMHYIDSEKLEGVELNGFVENDTHSDFHNGWMYKGADGASMKFKLNCKSLEIIYKANNMKAYADADIYVDGEKRVTVFSNQPDGWANPVTAFIIDDDTAAEHEIEIVVAGGQNNYFGILGFGYCD